MNKHCFMAILFVIVLSGCQNSETAEDIEPPSVLSGPYLGMIPPSDIPEIFAPEAVPDIGSEHTAIMFTPDGTEVFWSRIMNPGNSPRCMVIMHMKLENGVWIKPELASFNFGLYNFMSSISPDGKRLYFQAKLPEGSGHSPRSDGLVVEKTEAGWGTPRLATTFVPSEKRFFHFQETRSGNRYFSGRLPHVEGTVAFFRSKYVDGKYQEPEALGKTINSEFLDYAYHIDPDERFIIFSSNRPGGFADVELYISYHQPDDSWGPAINLGPKINSKFAGGTDWPYLSPDGKYLFFTASVEAYRISDVEDGTYEKLREISTSSFNGYSKIYWVDTSFVEKLKPREVR